MSAAPTALLLPGLNGTGVFYAELENQLDGIATCTRADLPSDCSQDYETLADHLSQSYERDTFDVIIAESFSGPLSVLAIANDVLCPKALILGATFVSSPFRNLPVRPVSDLASAFGMNRFVATTYIQNFLLNSGCELNAGEVYKEVKDLSAETISSRIQAATTVDMRAEFAALTLPILVLNAKHDRLIFSLDRKGFAANDNAEVIWLDAPHFMFQCAARDAARSIQSFLNDKGLLAA